MSGEGGRALLASGVVVVTLVVLAGLDGLGYGLAGLRNSTSAAARSLEALNHPPANDAPSALGRGWQHTPLNAVSFNGGYFCARGGQGGIGGRTVRLILALRELETLNEGSSKVVGPFANEAQARGEC